MSSFDHVYSSLDILSSLWRYFSSTEASILSLFFHLSRALHFVTLSSEFGGDFRVILEGCTFLVLFQPHAKALTKSIPNSILNMLDISFIVLFSSPFKSQSVVRYSQFALPVKDLEK